MQRLGVSLHVFSVDEPLLPFPGVIFPYNDPLDPKWYWTTLANCALVVDEKNQITFGSLWQQPRGTKNPEAKQLVFAPAQTCGMQRAWSDNLYAVKIVQDRALFLTGTYLADIVVATGDGGNHTYDLATHVRGRLSTTLPQAPFSLPEPVVNGYNALGNLRHATTDQAWSASIATAKGRTVHLVVPGGTATDGVVGDGHFIFAGHDEQPPTIIQRRRTSTPVLFASVLDVSGGAEPSVIGVTQQGGIDAGYALLTVQTTQGTDLCFTSYRRETFTVGGLETDALQAGVFRSGAGVRAMYLAGGTRLRCGGCTLSRSEPGLASLERLPNGDVVLANPSSTAAQLTVTMPALSGWKAFLLDSSGHRGQQAGTIDSAGTVTIECAPLTCVALSMTP